MSTSDILTMTKEVLKREHDELTRKLRLRGLCDLASHDGRDGLFFRRLPREVFVHVVAALEWRDAVQMSHVCFYWRKAIVNHPDLWTSLDQYPESVELVRTFAARSQGTLKHLHLICNLDGDVDLYGLPVLATLRQLLHEIVVHDAARSLRHLSVNLSAYTSDSEDIEPAYHAITLVTSFAQWSAVHLESFKIVSVLPRFPAGAPFFASLPLVDKVTLTSSMDEPDAEARLPDFLALSLSDRDSQVTSVALTALQLSSVALTDGSFPAFPNIHTLKLHDVNCSNLYGLLSAVRTTVKTLQLHNITSISPYRFVPGVAGTTVKDDPPTLVFPVIRHIEMAGCSPSLWSSPTPVETIRGFMTKMPALKSATFASNMHRPFDTYDEYGPFGCYNALKNAGCLQTFLRTSSSLEALNLCDAGLAEATILSGLAFAPKSLQRLDLHYAATDRILADLPNLVPNLVWLRISGSKYEPVYPFRKELYSLPALSRFVAAMTKKNRRSRNYQLTVVGEQFREAVPPKPEPTLASLRGELRTALAPLTPTQVEHLTNSLVLNNPAAGALEFEVVKMEVVVLSRAPSNEPVGTGKGKAKGGGEQKVMPASQDMVNQALKAMLRWQKKREDDWSLEFIGKCEGVELLWADDGRWRLNEWEHE